MTTKQIQTQSELAEFIAELIQETPAGWKREIAFRSAGDGETILAVATDPMTYSSWVEWGDEYPVVKILKWEPQNIPYFPEEYGATLEEAIENLAEEIASDWFYGDDERLAGLF